VFSYCFGYVRTFVRVHISSEIQLISYYLSPCLSLYSIGNVLFAFTWSSNWPQIKQCKFSFYYSFHPRPFLCSYPFFLSHCFPVRFCHSFYCIFHFLLAWPFSFCHFPSHLFLAKTKHPTGPPLFSRACRP